MCSLNHMVTLTVTACKMLNLVLGMKITTESVQFYVILQPIPKY